MQKLSEWQKAGIAIGQCLLHFVEQCPEVVEKQFVLQNKKYQVRYGPTASAIEVYLIRADGGRWRIGRKLYGRTGPEVKKREHERPLA